MELFLKLICINILISLTLQILIGIHTFLKIQKGNINEFPKSFFKQRMMKIIWVIYISTSQNNKLGFQELAYNRKNQQDNWKKVMKFNKWIWLAFQIVLNVNQRRIKI